MSGDIPFPKPKPAQLFGEPLGTRTIDPADAYAPTPAATARELAQEVLDTYAAADHEDFTPWRVRHDRLLQTCRDIIALAAAEAPGRVSYRDQGERLEKAFETLERLSQLLAAPTPSEPVARCVYCGNDGTGFRLSCCLTPGARDE